MNKTKENNIIKSIKLINKDNIKIKKTKINENINQNSNKMKTNNLVIKGREKGNLNKVKSKYILLIIFDHLNGKRVFDFIIQLYSA